MTAHRAGEQAPRAFTTATRRRLARLPTLERAPVRDEAVREACARAQDLLSVSPRQACAWAGSAVDLLAANGLPASAELAWRARRLKAKAHHAAGDFPEALELLDELGATRLPARRRADIESTRAILLARLDRVAESSRAARRARALFRGLGDSVGAAHVDVNQGNAFHRREEHAEARTLYLRALRTLERAGRLEDAGAALVGLGNAGAFLGRLTEADAAYRRAEGIFEQLGQGAGRRVAAYNRHYLALLAGRPQAALDGLAEVAAQFRAAGDERGVAHCQVDRAEVFAFLRCWPEARAEALAAKGACSRLGMHLEAARTTLVLARAEAGHGMQPDRVERLLAEAEVGLTALGQDVGVEMASLLRAEMLRKRGDLVLARRLAARAARMLGRRGQPSRSATARVAEAEALHGLGAVRAAEHAAEQARGTKGAGDWALVGAETLLAEMALARGDVPRARKLARRASSRLGQIGAGLAADRARHSLAADLERVPRIALAAELAGPRPRRDRALEVAEQARRFGLLDAAGGHGAGIAAWAAGERAGRAAARGPRGLRRLPSPRQAQVAPALDSGRALPLLDLADVQRRLAPGDLLVHLTTWPDVEGRGACALLLTRSSVEARTLPPAALQEFTARAHDGAERLALARVLAPEAMAPATAVLARSLTRLSAALLEPLAAHVDAARRILFVPDGMLAAIPWAALPWRAARLGEHAETVVLPAASWLGRADSRSASGAIILGASDAAAPRVDDEVDAVAAALRGSTPGGDIGRGGVIARKGRTATRAEWSRLAPQAAFVHLAGHGAFRADAPEQSALRLADGWLRAADMESTALRARLVSLSACHGGAARARGQQALGLVRSLQRAGARRVIATPWPVPDELAGALWPRVYSALAEGLAPASALRRAQHETAEGDSDVLAWSFTLHGRP